MSTPGQPIFVNTPSTSTLRGIPAAELFAVEDPKEAKRKLPAAEEEYTACARNTATAEAETERCKAVCTENGALRDFLSCKGTTTSRAATELSNELRTGLHACRESFADDQIARLYALRNAAKYYAEELDFLVSTKWFADDLVRLDSVTASRLADYNEAIAAAKLSHLRTVATLAEAYRQEGGEIGALGVIGKKTTTLREKSDIAWRAYKSAEAEAREARARYTQQQSVLSSRGVITSANISRAIPKF